MPDPKKNVAYTFNIGLIDSASRPKFKANPTIAAGDFVISKDEGTAVNLATLPVVGTFTTTVKIVLSAAEMNGDRIVVYCKDVAGGEWDEVYIFINTTVVTVDDLVRSITPVNSLKVDINNRAEVLLGAVTHTGAVIPTVSSLTGHTAQTADHAAAIAAIPTTPALASVCTEARLAELDAGNLPSRTDGIQTDLDNTTDGLGALKDLIVAIGVKKNTPLSNFTFVMIDKTDHVTPKIGETVTCQRSIDGDAFANCATATATEISNGFYKVDLADSDLNGAVIGLKFTAPNSDDTDLTVITQT